MGVAMRKPEIGQKVYTGPDHVGSGYILSINGSWVIVCLTSGHYRCTWADLRLMGPEDWSVDYRRLDRLVCH